MKKLNLFLFAVVIFLNSCINVDPYIDIKKNPYGTNLESVGTFTESTKSEITDFIENNSRFDACIAMVGDKVIYQ